MPECQYCVSEADYHCDNCEAPLCEEHAGHSSVEPSTFCACQEVCGTDASTTCGHCTWCQLHRSRKP